MGLQAIQAALQDGRPVFPVDQDTGDMTAAHWATGHGVSLQRQGAWIAFSPTHWLPDSKTVESSRARGRTVARASVTAGVCVLWFLIGAAGSNGLCGDLAGRLTPAQPSDAAPGKAAQ